MYRTHILVCGGTGCHSNNSGKIREAFEQQIKEKNIFCVIILIFSKLPFYARREARAASAAKPRSLDNINDLLRIELGQTFDKSLIPVRTTYLL